MQVKCNGIGGYCPGHLLSNSSMSLRAFGLFAFLQTVPSSLSFKQMSEMLLDGEESIKTGIEELIRGGYIREDEAHKYELLFTPEEIKIIHTQQKEKAISIEERIRSSIEWYKNEPYSSEKRYGKDSYYTKFVDWITSAPRLSLLTMESQLKHSDFVELVNLCEEKNFTLKDVFDEMLDHNTNNPKYLKGKKSLYLTAKNWIKNKKRVYV